MKSAIRKVAWRVAPSAMADRARTYERSVRQRAGLTNLATRFPPVVVHGPFTGLRYPENLLLNEADAPIAKLLGTYEQELQPVFDEIIARSPTAIIDLGTAEGYYAVGLARACPTSTVYAYELAGSARRACRELAAANGVTLTLRTNATAREMANLPLDRAFVLCDIEGAELSVLDTAVASSTATILVELHEREVPGITGVLRNRFQKHDCTIIQSQTRHPDRIAELQSFSVEERELAVDEWRGYVMTWGLFRPRT
jgi:hypothetical protein